MPKCCSRRILVEVVAIDVLETLCASSDLGCNVALPSAILFVKCPSVVLIGVREGGDPRLFLPLPRIQLVLKRQDRTCAILLSQFERLRRWWWRKLLILSGLLARRSLSIVDGSRNSSNDHRRDLILLVIDVVSVRITVVVAAGRGSLSARLVWGREKGVGESSRSRSRTSHGWDKHTPQIQRCHKHWRWRQLLFRRLDPLELSTTSPFVGSKPSFGSPFRQTPRNKIEILRGPVSQCFLTHLPRGVGGGENRCASNLSQVDKPSFESVSRLNFLFQSSGSISPKRRKTFCFERSCPVVQRYRVSFGVSFAGLKDPASPRIQASLEQSTCTRSIENSAFSTQSDKRDPISHR